MDFFTGGAIQNVKRSPIIREGAQSAAPACPGRIMVGGSLALESLAVVTRAGRPNTPLGLAILLRVTMPNDVNVPGPVRGDGPTTIQTRRELHHVVLRLKACPGIIQARVE